MVTNKDLKRRIIEISFQHKLSHLGSCLTAIDIIAEIFKIKKKNEKFILSCGHAGLALYVVLEKYEGLNAEKIWEHHGTHPDRCEKCHIDCSTGSLGNGLPIAVGMALQNRNKNVYCLISDGECSEGSIWEALRIAKEQGLANLKLYLNVNGFGAYKSIDRTGLERQIAEFWLYGVTNFCWTQCDFPFLKGLDAHYKVLNEQEYKQAIEILK